MESLNEENPPPSRECPRCYSDNTKFCYFNNYRASQPRYFCKNCRRYWTHGGALRDIPIGGSCRRPKRSKADQPSGSQVSQLPQVVSVDHIQQVQPYIPVQENEFLGPFGGSSSSSVMNHFGFLPDMHGGMMTNVTPHQSLPPVDRFDFTDGSFQNNYFGVGSNELIGNPLTNQSIAGNVQNHNTFQGFDNTMNMNHNSFQSFDNPMNMNHNSFQSFDNTMNMTHNSFQSFDNTMNMTHNNFQSFDNTMNMNHNSFQGFDNTMNMTHNNAGASGSRGSSGTEMNRNNDDNNI